MDSSGHADWLKGVKHLVDTTPTWSKSLLNSSCHPPLPISSRQPNSDTHYRSPSIEWAARVQRKGDKSHWRGLHWLGYIPCKFDVHISSYVRAVDGQSLNRNKCRAGGKPWCRGQSDEGDDGGDQGLLRSPTGREIHLRQKPRQIWHQPQLPSCSCLQLERLPPLCRSFQYVAKLTSKPQVPTIIIFETICLSYLLLLI